MVAQQHPVGFEAEIDFGAVSFYLTGVFTLGEMFVMRLSASGKAFRSAYLGHCQARDSRGLQPPKDYTVLFGVVAVPPLLV